MTTPAQIRSSSQVRKDFLDFFKSKQHTIVPSSSLMPDSPNLLFTNAGMNQFVPIFLGQTKCPYTPGRAADTQKCIRAGGKHNDLDDVGLDTYHHTFFEMLGNWSFGDYFKREAIEWAWELVVEKWKFPPQRLYATVYLPDKSKNDPSEFDQEAWNFWAEKFRSVGLDPAIHIVNGNKKDNFWMMGETGPCGPCSELHVDLTPDGDTRGNLVNKGDARCIEIWNLVFIQFNANPDGTFSPLPANHVDTGMGFERVTSIIQGTKNFSDFANAKISNYETDIFRPIFDELEKLSGKKYGSTLPTDQSQISNLKSQIAEDIAFRVIADHIRTLGFAIADGIQPGNTDRNYVLRRILRRAVRYGRTLGFHEPFFYKLVGVLADTMGDVFLEIRARKKQVQETIRTEEEAFNKTLDKGLELFGRHCRNYSRIENVITASKEFLEKAKSAMESVDENVSLSTLFENNATSRLFNWKPTIKTEFLRLAEALDSVSPEEDSKLHRLCGKIAKALRSLASKEGYFFSRETGEQFSELPVFEVNDNFKQLLADLSSAIDQTLYATKACKHLSGDFAFKLYDTYGFPIDLTELMARDRGLTVGVAGFNTLLEEQRARARAAQKKEIISASEVDMSLATEFVGFKKLETQVKVVAKGIINGKPSLMFNRSPLYAEMGGQVGDIGIFESHGKIWNIANTIKKGDVWIHFVGENELPELNARGSLKVNQERRKAIQRHHTVTHLLHWALHEVASKEASQKGSFVGPDKLTFDFNSAPLTPAQVADIEKLVNERILENAGVSWTEVAHADVKNRKDVMQFFGDKYGDTVRVVQIGGGAGNLDGYSMELCGGTHTRATGEIGLFRIVGESAIAAGVRRIEAVAGLEAYRKANDELHLIKTLAGRLNSPVHELEKKIEALLEHQKAIEKSLRTATMREASNAASNLLEQIQTVNGIPTIIHNIGGVDGDFLQAVADSLKGRFKGVIVLGGATSGAVSLVAAVSAEYVSKIQAGKIIQQIAPLVGGKGGGKPDNARGGGKDAAKLDEALAKAKTLLG